METLEAGRDFGAAVGDSRNPATFLDSGESRIRNGDTALGGKIALQPIAEFSDHHNALCRVRTPQVDFFGNQANG